jgi:hypothetical protein
MKATILVLALAAAAAPAIKASPVLTGLYNTGVDNSGTAFSNIGLNGTGVASTDSHFTTEAGTFAQTYYISPYVADQPGSGGADWITTACCQPPTDETAGGLYNYVETLTSLVSTPITVTGSWATDNCGTILVNSVAAIGTGTTVGGGITSATCNDVASDFTSLTPFSISLPTAAAGTTYTLDFEVFNDGAGPTALLVTDLQATAATPEPSSALLALTGFVLLGVGIQRRRAANRKCA